MAVIPTDIKLSPSNHVMSIVADRLLYTNFLHRSLAQKDKVVCQASFTISFKRPSKRARVRESLDVPNQHTMISNGSTPKGLHFRKVDGDKALVQGF